VLQQIGFSSKPALEDLDHVAGCDKRIGEDFTLDGFIAVCGPDHTSIIFNGAIGKPSSNSNAGQHGHSWAIGIFAGFCNFTQNVDRAVGKYLDTHAGISQEIFAAEHVGYILAELLRCQPCRRDTTEKRQGYLILIINAELSGELIFSERYDPDLVTAA
jgi:hypothetical protein